MQKFYILFFLISIFLSLSAAQEQDSTALPVCRSANIMNRGLSRPLILQNSNDLAIGHLVSIDTQSNVTDYATIELWCAIGNNSEGYVIKSLNDQLYLQIIDSKLVTGEQEVVWDISPSEFDDPDYVGYVKISPRGDAAWCRARSRGC